MPYKNKELNIRCQTIFNWKKQGINILDTEHGYEIYKMYKETTHCDLCNILLPKKRDLDHDHKTGEIRNIVCHKCNMWKKDYNKSHFIVKRFRQDRNKDYYYIQIMRNGHTVLTTKATCYEKAVKIRDNFIKANPSYFK